MLCLSLDLVRQSQPAGSRSALSGYLCLFLQVFSSPSGFKGHCCCRAVPGKFIFLLLSEEEQFLYLWAGPFHSREQMAKPYGSLLPCGWEVSAAKLGSI